ncbi:hypothetical protein RJT34_15143 [Clitoria ternatea]|uniref:Uncharacterized protein n=1 Tax=Clitoria ternatea TaxID=43366 RepID=A0AAN9PNM3_CLITE
MALHLSLILPSNEGFGVMASTVEEEHLDYDSDLKDDKRSNAMRWRREASDNEDGDEPHHSVRRLDTTPNTCRSRQHRRGKKPMVLLEGKERQQMVPPRADGDVDDGREPTLGFLLFGFGGLHRCGKETVTIVAVCECESRKLNSYCL